MNNILELLSRNNPFASVSAGDPRQYRFPDVPEVDRDVFESLLNLIAQKKSNPTMPCAAAVTGEAGSGKTQLIGRLVDHGNQGKNLFNFAYIPPFVDPEQGYRYLLRELVLNLGGKSSAGADLTQMEHICCQIFKKVFTLTAQRKGTENLLATAKKIQKNPLKGWKSIEKNPVKIKKQWFSQSKTTLQVKHPGVEPIFFSVFLQYLFYPERRLAAEQWLKGFTIDSEHVNLLKVPDRSNRPPESLEDEARRIILALDEVLLEYGDRPIVLFFDQLEALHGEKVLKKFQDMLQLLTDRTRTMMPLVFLRGNDWEQRFRVELDHFIYDRLRGRQYNLDGCTRAQAREIVRLRLEMALGDAPRPDPLYPFLPEHQKKFETIFRAKRTLPRQVVVRAGKLLSEICGGKVIIKEPDDKLVQQALKTRYEEVLANIDQYEPDEGRLTLALELYLKSRPEGYPFTAPVLERTTETVRYLDMQGKISSENGTFEVAFLIDVERHFRAVAAGLKRGLNFLRQKKTSRALFIRDSRAEFPQPPKWKKTNEMLQDFRKKGGGVVFLEAKDAAFWYALALTSFALDSGDIIRDDGTCLEQKHLISFLSANIFGQVNTAFGEIDEYMVKPKEPENGGSEKDSDWVETAKNVLRQDAAGFMKADLLASEIGRRLGKKVPLEDLLPALGKREEIFSIMRARDGVTVRLIKKVTRKK